MATKCSLRKQIIVLMNNANKTKFTASSSNYITNINRVLKNIRLDIVTNYVHLEWKGITIVTNKVALSLDLQVIENYVINIDSFNSEDIDTSFLS